MKAMKISVLIILALLLAALIVYYWYGGFETLNIKIEKQGGETVVYEDITGDYSQSGEVMDKVYYTLLNDNNIKTTKGFGIYYDNPRIVEKEKLRSEAGCIIEDSDIPLVSSLNNGLKRKELPFKNYIVTEFPYKGKISVFFSLIKVYPALEKFVQQNGMNGDGAVIEIYDIPNKKIMYRKEIME